MARNDIPMSQADVSRMLFEREASREVLQEAERLRYRKFYAARKGSTYVIYDNGDDGPENVEIIAAGYPYMKEGSTLEATFVSPTKGQITLTHSPVWAWDRDLLLLLPKTFEYNISTKVTDEGGLQYLVQYGLLTQEQEPPKRRAVGVTNLLPIAEFVREFGRHPVIPR